MFIYQLSAPESCCFVLSMRCRDHLPCHRWSGPAGCLKQRCLSWVCSTPRKKEGCPLSHPPPSSETFLPFLSKLWGFSFSLATLTIAWISFLLLPLKLSSKLRFGEIRILMTCRLFQLLSLSYLAPEAVNLEHSVSLNGRKKMWQSQRKISQIHMLKDYPFKIERAWDRHRLAYPF